MLFNTVLISKFNGVIDELVSALRPSQCRGALLRSCVVRTGRETDDDDPAPSFTMVVINGC